jgi:hypothetical protein
MTEFQVRKDNISKHRVVAGVPAENAPHLANGKIRVKIERFAFTANNVTYAVTGDRIGYWQFFPPGGEDRRHRRLGHDTGLGFRRCDRIQVR